MLRISWKRIKYLFPITAVIVLLIASIAIPVQALSGGPDAFGYKFKDSNEVGGPTYNWIEISGTGTQILINTDDIVAFNIPIGFTFNFYGTDYTQFAISNNGLFFSGAAWSQWTNQPIMASTPHGFIAPFWDDLTTWATGTAWYETIGTAPNRIFVVEWKDCQHYASTPSGVTLQAIMYEGSNNILFQYQDVDFGDSQYNNGLSATVGIENPVGDVGLQYSYNQAVLAPGLAILFTHPEWEEPEEPEEPEEIEVGGDIYPINKTGILAPWIALAAVLVAGTAIILRRRQVQS